MPIMTRFFHQIPDQLREGAFPSPMIWERVILVQRNIHAMSGGIDRECFSYMTCEQLTNWVLCAGVYWVETRDDTFIAKHKETLLACLQSLLNRDHPDAARAMD